MYLLYIEYISMKSVHTHIPTPKDVRNIPPTKKINKKNTIPSAVPDIKKLNHQKTTHKTNQHLTSRSNPPFQTSPLNRSTRGFNLQRIFFFFETPRRRDFGAADPLNLYRFSLPTTFAQCPHCQTLLLQTWANDHADPEFSCEKMSLSERKNGSGEYEFCRYEWGCDFRFLNEIRCFFPMVVSLLWIWIWWSHHVLFIFTCECVHLFYEFNGFSLGYSIFNAKQTCREESL